MRIAPEISGTNIVLVGRFNPLIFTGAWFALHGLLPENSLDQKLAHEELTQLNSKWMNLEVRRNRFSISTFQAPYLRICDLVLRIFREKLCHTPIASLGINREVHFCVSDFQIREKIGRKLAPIEPWGKLGNEIGLNSEHGGMTTLVMTRVSPEGRTQGDAINIKVQPSNVVGNGRTGVYVEINDHYSFEVSSPESCNLSMESLEKNFESSLNHSSRIIDQIMSLAEN